MKEEMGFEWWSIRKEGSEMKVAFDDPTIESDVSGKTVLETDLMNVLHDH